MLLWYEFVFALNFVGRLYARHAIVQASIFQEPYPCKGRETSCRVIDFMIDLDVSTRIRALARQQGEKLRLDSQWT